MTQKVREVKIDDKRSILISVSEYEEEVVEVPIKIYTTDKDKNIIKTERIVEKV
jgi:hypothetical protein